jgi:hypothetical protein
VIDEQPKDGSADHQRQQRGRHLNPDDVFLSLVEATKPVLRLQLTDASVIG